MTLSSKKSAAAAVNNIEGKGVDVVAFDADVYVFVFVFFLVEGDGQRKRQIVWQFAIICFCCCFFYLFKLLLFFTNYKEETSFLLERLWGFSGLFSLSLSLSLPLFHYFLIGNKKTRVKQKYLKPKLLIH